MNFNQMCDFLAEKFQVNPNDIEVWIGDFELEDESYLVNMNDDGNTLIVDTWIRRVVIDGKNYDVDLYIYACIDQTIQESYEKRLILCNLFIGEEYNNESTLVIPVKSSFGYAEKYDGLARIIYKFKESIVRVRQNEIAMAAWHPGQTELFTSFIKVKEICTDETPQKTWDIHDISSRSPIWLQKIKTKSDLYKSPLNQKHWDKIEYLEDDSIYQGENLVYKKDLIALIRLGYMWVKLEPSWLETPNIDLPKHILDEFEFMKSLN